MLQKISLDVFFEINKFLHFQNNLNFFFVSKKFYKALNQYFKIQFEDDKLIQIIHFFFMKISIKIDKKRKNKSNFFCGDLNLKFLLYKKSNKKSKKFAENFFYNVFKQNAIFSLFEDPEFSEFKNDFRIEEYIKNQILIKFPELRKMRNLQFYKNKKKYFDLFFKLFQFPICCICSCSINVTFGKFICKDCFTISENNDFLHADNCHICSYCCLKYSENEEESFEISRSIFKQNVFSKKEIRDQKKIIYFCCENNLKCKKINHQIPNNCDCDCHNFN